MPHKQKILEKSIEKIQMSADINKPAAIVVKSEWVENPNNNEAPYVIKTIGTNIYEDVYSPNISIRDSFDRADYDYYRPGEYIPKDSKGKIIACMNAYKESGNGIVKNIVDLIADLVVQGIDVVHKKRKNEKFAKAWFSKMVNGPSVSERLVNLLCRSGNDVIKRDMGRIPLNKIRKLYKGESVNSGEVNIKEITTVKREIPIKYTFIDPRILAVYHPQLSMFLNNEEVQFSLDVPTELMRSIQYPKTEQEQALIDLIPSDISSLVKRGIRQLPLDKNKIRTIFYKKDDWEVWADPMIYPVLADLNALKKMKLADLSALDGVLSQIRIWKLGSMENKIRAGQPAMTRLAQILQNGVAGGILDIIWSDDIDCQEISSNLHQFLGDAKYVPILNAIYAGLGIPPLFAGASTQGSFTSNFLSIKTFIVRLEYLRDKLKEFWNKEFEILQAAMEWDEPPILVFDRMTLNDESSILQIMLHMVDRGILSDEALQEMVGAVPEIEAFRTSREWQDRKRKKKQPKASPFHNPDFEKNWMSQFIQGGELVPSQVGLELNEPKKGEVPPNEAKFNRDETVKMPNDLGGRPVGGKDKIKRKTKTVKPQRGVSQQLISTTIWASETQDKINEYLTPIFLDMLGKKNLRQLTNEEFHNFEKLKFGLLVNCQCESKFDSEQVRKMLESNQVSVPLHISSLLSEMLKVYKEENGVDPTTDIIRRFQCITYAANQLDNEISANNSNNII